MQAVSPKAGFISLDETHLSERRCSLQMMKLPRAPLPSQALHALRNCTGRHQQHFPLAPLELGDLLGPPCERLMVEAVPLIGD